jgi:5-methylcytosine-specific restriction endonuclease McrA
MWPKKSSLNAKSKSWRGCAMHRVTDYPKIEKIYYDDLSQRRYQRHNNQTLEEVYAEKFEVALGCDLRTLLCGGFDEITQIALPEEYRDEIAELFDYQHKFQKPISDIFSANLDIYTCYYCNIDFVNVFDDSTGETKSGYTLDHIKSKGEYPHLTLSLYNLIPACYICNTKIKREQDLGNVSPTSKAFDFDERVKFKTFMINKNLQIHKENDFELLLKEDFSDIYQKYLEVLELDGRYAYHKYKVIELINKHKTYPDSRIRELAELTQKTEEEVKQDIFGEYLPNALHKRPLSKLSKDISAELGLV